MSNPSKETRRRVGVRIPNELYLQLKALSEREWKTITDLVIEAVDKYLKWRKVK